MFDWDKDQESLVALPAAEQGQDSSGNADTSGIDAPIQLRSRMGLGAIGLILVIGFAYEKDVLSQVRGGSLTGFWAVVAPAPPSGQADLPQGLTVYDAAQARAFLRGLSLADTATLQAYQFRNKVDLAAGNPAFAPFHRDAEALLAFELARRAAGANR